MLSTIHDADRKQKWTQIRSQINVECEHVKDITAVLQSFKQSDPVPPIGGVGGGGGGAPVRRHDNNIILPQDDNGNKRSQKFSPK